VVRLARELGKNGVAVELTVQVESVSLGRDGRIPPNVPRAADFYQKERLTFRGEDYIQAEGRAADGDFGRLPVSVSVVRA
jgi:hypothetical protein